MRAHPTGARLARPGKRVQLAEATLSDGNGISMELSLATHLFVNAEITVHLFREPEGEWVCLDARTRIGPGGAGLATSALYDSTGRFGIGNQALLVRSR